VFSDNTTDYRGLFPAVSGSQIFALALNAPAVTGSSRTGALCGTLTTAGVIHDVYVKGGSVTGNGYVGGVCGEVTNRTSLLNSYSTASVSAGWTYYGGIFGDLNSAQVLNSFAAGNVSAAATQTGALCYGGNSAGGATNLYYDSTKTCTNCSAATGTVAAASTDLYDKTKAPLSSWDFTNTWLENAADYPSFQP
jgi:hypothetical protein